MRRPKKVDRTFLHILHTFVTTIHPAPYGVISASQFSWGWLGLQIACTNKKMDVKTSGGSEQALF